MPDEKRTDIYRDLHQGQLNQEEAQTYHSASVILSVLREYFSPLSLLDVGCGLGIWLKAAMDSGIQDVLGIEGPWIKESKPVIPPALIQPRDLEHPFSLGRRFDAVVCSEVGEHLSKAAAPVLVDSLAAHADYVLFSAAIPYQGGHHHINEQFLPYWEEQFARNEYVLLDLFRGRSWDDESIHWWLRQNLVLFVRRDVAEQNPALREQLKVTRPVSVVHPGLFMSRLRTLNATLRDHRQLLAVVKDGGRFEVTKTADNQIIIKRID